MSIALEMKVQSLESRVERLEGVIQRLEGEIETLKSLPALMTDVSRGTNTNGRPQKR